MKQLQHEGWVLKPDTNKSHAELLNTDLSQVGEKIFPTDFASLTTLPSPRILQLKRIKDVSHPKISHENGSNKSMFRVTLTDGHSSCTAMNLQTIQGLHGKAYPGTKIRIKGAAQVLGGFVLLTPGNCEVLGGRVEKLVENIEKNEQITMKTTSSGGPPKFVPFGSAGKTGHAPQIMAVERQSQHKISEEKPQAEYKDRNERGRGRGSGSGKSAGSYNTTHEENNQSKSSSVTGGKFRNDVTSKRDYKKERSNFDPKFEPNSEHKQFNHSNRSKSRGNSRGNSRENSRDVPERNDRNNRDSKQYGRDNRSNDRGNRQNDRDNWQSDRGSRQLDLDFPALGGAEPATKITNQLVDEDGFELHDHLLFDPKPFDLDNHSNISKSRDNSRGNSQGNSRDNSRDMPGRNEYNSRDNRSNDRGNWQSDRGNRQNDRGNRQNDRGSRQDDRGNRQNDRGNRQNDRGNRQSDRGNRQNDRGNRQNDSGNWQSDRGSNQNDRNNRTDDRGNWQSDRGSSRNDSGSSQNDSGNRQNDRGNRQNDRGNRQNDRGNRQDDGDDYNENDYIYDRNSAGRDNDDADYSRNNRSTGRSRGRGRRGSHQQRQDTQPQSFRADLELDFPALEGAAPAAPAEPVKSGSSNPIPPQNCSKKAAAKITNQMLDEDGFELHDHLLYDDNGPSEHFHDPSFHHHQGYDKYRSPGAGQANEMMKSLKISGVESSTSGNSSRGSQWQQYPESRNQQGSRDHPESGNYRDNVPESGNYLDKFRDNYQDASDSNPRDSGYLDPRYQDYRLDDQYHHEKGHSYTLDLTVLPARSKKKGSARGQPRTNTTVPQQDNNQPYDRSNLSSSRGRSSGGYYR